MSQRYLDHLSTDDCFELLADQEVGRLVYVDENGPVAVPVNYAVDRGTLVFRIEHGSKEAALEHPVAFEVDHVNGKDHSGWSVLVRGRTRELSADEVVEFVGRVKAGFPRPWAEGIHNHWLSLQPTGVTGRRLGQPVDEG